MSKVIKIKKGLDIKLLGKAEKIYIKAELSEKYAVKPTDFPGIFPKLAAKPGTRVKAGATLFYDKTHPEVKFTAPVSGEVAEVNRGERRRILEVVINADKEIEYETFAKGDPANLSKEKIAETILESGMWPAIRQRPYAIIANPADTPRDIFISAFDSAPLAPDYDFLVKDREVEFQTGIDALNKLTTGDIHLGLNARYPASGVFENAKNVKKHYFKGPHPAGNVGIQIHHVKPINKGEIIWYLNPQDVIIIGRLFMKGIYDASKVVALTGSEVLKPRYYKMISGACITPLIKDNLKKEFELRFISGNPLTGSKITSASYLGYYDSQVTIIPEGNYYEFFGWASPGFKKYSMSRTFFSWLQPEKRYRIDTNKHGGERAYVITSQYEKVFPMDIYPVSLVKSIMIEDVDLMEKLGIYEVAEEDMALCEFVCTSKIPVQSIVRQGLDMMKNEMG